MKPRIGHVWLPGSTRSPLCEHKGSNLQISNFSDFWRLAPIRFPEKYESFAEHHQQWGQDALRNGANNRESHWTEAIAAGSSGYAGKSKERLGIKAAGRRIEKQDGDIFIIREEPTPHKVDFDLEYKALRLELVIIGMITK